MGENGNRLILWALLGSCLLGLHCEPATKTNSNGNQGPSSSLGYEIVNTWPHDSSAYTQGLIFHEGNLLESTGQHGRSSLRRVELETGKVIQKVDLPDQYFAEGLTLLSSKLYQLTWEHHKGFIYDVLSFEKLGEFNYAGEGWGLTNDGESLILSDGTNRLLYLDPVNFQVRKTVNVLDHGVPVDQLNELEFVKGQIFANVWHQDRIARIDPQSGQVLGWIMVSGLIPPSELSNEEAVLNGIAYDEKGDRLFVTGKLWPKLFEIRIKE